MPGKNKRNLIAIGGLTVLAVIVFFWGFYYLLGTPVLKGGMDLNVLLPNGAGLKRGNPVYLHGVVVGSTSEVRLNNANSVIARIRLDDVLQLPADTRARVSGDVFGAHMVELIPGSAMVHLEDEDTIRGITAPAFAELAGELGGRAGGILARADTLLSSEVIRDLQATAAVLPTSALELQAALRELKLASLALRRTTEEIESAKTGEALRMTMTRVDSTARALTSIAAAMERSAGSMESVFRKIDTGQGTLGRLVNDTSLYVNLNEAAREIRVIAADFKANPRKYINLQIF